MQHTMQAQFIRNKLKLAVIAALSVIAICVPHQAFALGLGDIDVRSHLGQPLRAKVRVLGASSISDPSCFKLGSDSGNPNQLTNAYLKLGNITGDTAILSISTSEVMNEPIVNLAVVAECGTTLRRDYVLLMNPPFMAEAERPSNNAANAAGQSNEQAFDADDNSIASSVNSKEQAVLPQAQTLTRATKKAATKKPRARKKPNKNISLNTNNDANYGANPRAEGSPKISSNVTAQNPPKDVVPIESKPRLTISSGASSVSANMIGLQLDNQLHFDPVAAPIEQAGEIAMQDEVTVMNNRLAHLEQQINKLKQRNTTLESENKTKDLQIAQEQEKLPGNKLQWLAYLTYGVLLIGGYFAADWWRRRRQNLQLENSETVWENLHRTETSAVALDTSDEFFGRKTAELANTSDDKLSSDTEFAGGFMPTQAMEAPFFMEEDNSESNILDHADVFLSHGRTSLAIQLLQNHLLDFPKQSVTIWLFLLDLLAKVNLQAVYEQTAIECREHFNVKIPEYNALPDAAYNETSQNQSLESFPRLTTGLQQVWGTPASITFMDDLIYNSRLEVRVGFDKNLIEELVLLKSIAMEELKTGMVVPLDDKKSVINELKEAQIASKKADKLLKMDELPIALPDESASAPDRIDETATTTKSAKPEKPATPVKREELPPLEFTKTDAMLGTDAPPAKPSESFEFNLVDFNQKH